MRANEVHCNLDSQAAVAHPVVVEEVARRLPVECGTCDPQRYLRGDHLTWFQSQHLSVFPVPLLIVNYLVVAIL